MHALNDLLGLETDRLTLLQMALRTVIIFIASLLFVRIAGIRTFGKKTIFDQVTALMLGTLLGNAIFNAKAPFFPILFASFILMLLHRMIAWMTFGRHKLGNIIKGKPLLIIKHGELQEENMKRTLITKSDIEESIRLSGNKPEINKIEEAYIERSGNISIIKKEKE